jgi:hypothetical protein
MSKRPDENNKVEFDTPEGEKTVDCGVTFTEGTAETPGRIGITAKTGDCKLDLSAKEEFGEALQPNIANDPDVLDSITLPIFVGAKNIPYEITVEEKKENEEISVLVTLAKRSLQRDRALNITLQTVL